MSFSIWYLERVITPEQLFDAACSTKKTNFDFHSKAKILYQKINKISTKFFEVGDPFVVDINSHP